MRIENLGDIAFRIRTKGKAIAIKIIASWWLEVMKNAESEDK